VALLDRQAFLVNTHLDYPRSAPPPTPTSCSRLAWVATSRLGAVGESRQRPHVEHGGRGDRRHERASGGGRKCAKFIVTSLRSIGVRSP